MFISKTDLGDIKGQLKEIREDINVSQYITLLDGTRVLWDRRSVAKVIQRLSHRLDEQEKMTRMILAHLGLEYAKTTEETATGKQEKEVLRKIKKQMK